MPTTTVDGDLQVRGTINCDGINVPADSIGDAEMDVNDPIAVDKQIHQFTPFITVPHGAAATALREVVHVARGDGTLREFRCGVTVANVGGATITFDLLRNGASVLSAAKVLTNAEAAYTVQTGSLATSPTAYSDGDVFEVAITVAAGGGTIGQGPWAQPVFHEEHD